MEETFANPNFNTDPTAGGIPASQNAASDLRAAAGDKAQQIAHDASAKAQHLKQSAVEKAQQFREFAGTKATEIKDSASVRAQQLKQAAGEQVQQGRAKAREAHAETEEYIRQHPTKAVVTAFGIGLVIGLILRR